MTIDDLIRAAAPPERRKWAETNRIAIHEAGHVVAHMSYGHVVSRVSIVSTEHTSGHTVTELDGLCLTAAELETVAVTSLAGRAAEIVLLGCPRPEQKATSPKRLASWLPRMPHLDWAAAISPTSSLRAGRRRRCCATRNCAPMSRRSLPLFKQSQSS